MWNFLRTLIFRSSKQPYGHKKMPLYSQESSASTSDNAQWRSYASKCNDEGIELIKRFEGFRAEPYICAGGYNTIGYGHVILPHESFSSITEAQAEELLRVDIIKAENAVKNHVKTKLNSNQFSALVSFTFNLGSGALQSSTLLRRVNADQFDDVPYQLMRWVYAGGRKLKGLERRREAECVLWCK